MSKGKEIRDWETTGQGLYKAGKFADALDAFNKAVLLAQKWSPSDVPAILDQRVVIHRKLGNIDAARKDATSMIRANKADARGYLRCAQLDRSEDNPSAALRWCEHGLKHVAKSDSWRALLLAQRDKVKVLIHQKLMTSKSRDPLSILPAELFHNVLMLLDYRDIVKALRVSKAWMRALSGFKLMTDTIDFSGAQCTINYKMMVAALKRLGANPKKLVMKDISEPAAHVLRGNLRRWHNYTQLEMLTIAPSVFHEGTLPFGRYHLKSLVLEGGVIDGVEFLNILKECSSLEVGRFPRVHGFVEYSALGDDGYPLPLCRNLRRLHLGGETFDERTLGYYRVGTRVRKEFLMAFPLLEELVCEKVGIMPSDPFDLSGLTGLRRLVFKSCTMRSWPQLPPNIEVWDNYDLVMDHVNAIYPSYWSRGRLGELGKLKFLRINKTNHLPPIAAFMPNESTSSITTLDIRNTPIKSPLGTTFLAESLPHLTSVRELAWGGVHREEDVTLQILCCFEELETLSLLASQFHGSDLVTLLKRPNNRLKSIVLTDCENISPDTIEWARSRGVAVHVKKSQVA